ncbi:RNA polymerase sigma factor [Leucobacter tenebrionis]|uniref:RNA polymerase sigma factor n=1 Tax=Leucobacter tenebrionis TaxID=2873270 RepID=UPI001CA6B01D|nr:sigma-70 family RNA polymerase sigma factor [Leucobacter tenebrionis]QZY51476.1 sigma-70 family RNA polymerase sigma factor [Leucobacter tenebrionis]
MNPEKGHPQDEVRRALAAIDRDARSRITATIARWFGDLDLAEDVTQDALAQALRSWSHTGVPASPEAWLKTTAKRKALDTVRRESVLAQKLARLRIEEDRSPAREGFADPAEAASEQSPSPIPDDRLELFFACAHPVLGPADRIALTLRFLAGLTTAEVAHALLLPVTTVQQRIVRAKKRIRTLGVPFKVPARSELPARLAEVERVIYLLYAEGFARSNGSDHVRDDLTAEAIRLARVLHGLMPGEPEVTGLLSLLLLTEARRPARLDDGGRPVPLAQQDRGRWDRSRVEEGIDLAETAARAGRAGPYAIQAAIAAVHAEAADFAATDWAQIAVLYEMLERCQPGPIVRLGRAVALGRARGFATGLAALESLAEDPVLASFRPFHIARAVTLEEAGDRVGAAAAYRRALELPGNDAERDYLDSALAGLE